MTLADKVRKYPKTRLVDPARIRGDTVISIRAGDVHKAQGLKNRLPLVCSALGANTLKELARVQRFGLEGPTNGAKAVFTFRLR